MPRFYAYEPSFAAAVVFIVVFFILSAIHAFQIVRNRTWFFIPFLIGCLQPSLTYSSIVEAAGYIGRAIGAKETPDWTLTPFAIQIILLLLGPTFYAASIYMILGRLVRLLNAEKYSLIRPSWLTKFFLLGDIISIAAQALGGGMLSNAKTTTDFERGETIIILGLAIQVVFFGLFMLVTCLFHYRLRRNPSTESCRDDVKWEKFLIVLYVTGILILIRSIFRMVEYIQGSESELQTTEVYIYIFDATLMAMVAMIFVYYHPSKFMVLPALTLHNGDCGEELGPYDAVPLSTGYHSSYGRVQ